ncbi:MAG: ATP-binding cassette domain-containing protein [Simkaniaceae bacterium]|nr:ATP-binding cassette domain-containing protein [Simkaniaceae bacterium]
MRVSRPYHGFSPVVDVTYFSGCNMARILFEDVTLDLPVYGSSSRSFKRECIRMATGGLIRKREEGRREEVRALDGLALTVENGARLGLIGHNGSGKSSFLRVVSGIYAPTAGVVRVRGKVTPLLDVMFAMYEDLSGHENITLRGTLHELSGKEIEERREEIAEMSGLGDYMHMPIRTYSAGMKVRLAFCINTAVRSEILVIDELVGAGDDAFKEVAEKKIDSLISSADIFVIASHDTSWIRRNCNRVLWLDAGKSLFYGDVEEGIARYRERASVRRNRADH